MYCYVLFALLVLSGVDSYYHTPSSTTTTTTTTTTTSPPPKHEEKPLILTPLIEQNQIEAAKNSCQVNIHPGTVSYSGYFTVNKTFNSNLFFWFVPAKVDYANAPVILWLQGGPGVTSLLGLFGENGPFTINDKNLIKLREYAWTKTHSVLYVDNPVGTGFSFTDNGGHCQNQNQIADQLHEALGQFFTLFSELKNNPFFVAGETYGGKYAAALAHKIHQQNINVVDKIKINLQGIVIGSGFVDPIHQLGNISSQGTIGKPSLKAKLKEIEKRLIKKIESKDWSSAHSLYDKLIKGKFTNSTAVNNNYNYQVSDNDKVKNILEKIAKCVDTKEVKAALHVGKAKFKAVSRDVLINLKSDILKTVSPWICELLEHYKVLMYCGHQDASGSSGFPFNLSYLRALKFKGSEAYARAQKKKWYIENKLVGYVKEGGNLVEVTVNNAGSHVPLDQPECALELISKFVKKQPIC